MADYNGYDNTQAEPNQSALDNSSEQAAFQPLWATTMAIGEEGNPGIPPIYTTLAVGEEADVPTY